MSDLKKVIEFDEIGLKIGSATAKTYDCGGTLSITSKSISKTKKCGATEEVVAVIVTGAGTATVELHMENDDVMSIFGIGTKSGKKGFGAKKGNRRPDVCMTVHGTDEDENEVLIAVPLSKVTSDEVTAVDVDNGSTDISYTSLELAYRPDDNGYGFYGMDVEDLPSTVTADSWMTAFDASKIIGEM